MSAPTGRRGFGLWLELTMVGLSVAVAGCQATIDRYARVQLGKQAVVEVDGRSVAIAAGGDITLPTPAKGGSQELVLREGNKPLLVATLDVFVDLPPAQEDELLSKSLVNTIVVRTGGAGGLMAHMGRSVTVGGDPLSRLIDPDGPWFLPASGQGVVVVGAPLRSVVTVGDQVRQLELTSAITRQPKPLVVVLEPGGARLRVECDGFAPLETLVGVVANRFELVDVRLAPSP